VLPETLAEIQAQELLLHTALGLHNQEQLLWLLVVGASKQAPGFLLPAGLAPLCWQQCHWTVILEAWANIRAPEFLLLTGLVPLSWQQLPWLLVLCGSK
jgi:hypothetical protein